MWDFFPTSIWQQTTICNVMIEWSDGNMGRTWWLNPCVCVCVCACVCVCVCVCQSLQTVFCFHLPREASRLTVCEKVEVSNGTFRPNIWGIFGTSEITYKTMQRLYKICDYMSGKIIDARLPSLGFFQLGLADWGGTAQFELPRAGQLWRRGSVAEPTVQRILLQRRSPTRGKLRYNFLITFFFKKWIYLQSCLLSGPQQWSMEVTFIVRCLCCVLTAAN